MSNSELQLIEVVEIDGILVVRFYDLNNIGFELSQIERLETELASVVDRNPQVVILDFQSKDFIPAGIINHVFIELFKRLGEKMRMCHLPESVADHFQMLKLDTLFQIDSTLEGSLATVKSARTEA